MNENKNIAVKDAASSNIRMAIILGIVALIVGLMPFLYLRNMVIPS